MLEKIKNNFNTQTWVLIPIAIGINIAVGQIDVGNAETELAQRMTQGVQQANGQIAAEPLMDVAIVGQSVLYMANLPLEANVMFHTVMATKMPFAGRG